MKTNLTILAAAALTTLAACDKLKEPATAPKVETPSQNRMEAPGSPPGAPTPSVMNQGAPMAPQTSAEEKKSAQPVQGQVDTTQPAQRKDFQTR